MTNPLYRYLKIDKRMAITDFAEAVGVSRETVWRWCTGAMRIRSRHVERIEKVTNGAIKYKDLGLMVQ